ncbi:putative RDD family membrane protein YckC [Nocardiopsis mwathae]|uniref:Putative RDD family membrane protein YckC n=1 Tax=Nocardiopsis mwathae TaxID=1472723 RepID=A0A7W9YFH4_9ACTN|nr:putative RDD family membrane protein YckC [Nocardiopsis mwathae]
MPQVAPARPPATWLRRTGARLVDLVLVMVPSAVAAGIVGLVWLGALALGGGAKAENFFIIFCVCYFLILVGYDAVNVARRRRTAGKKLLDLEVAPREGGGHPGPIPIASIVARAAVFHVWVLFWWIPGWNVVAGILFLVFCVLWPLWSRPYGQGVHDHVARTIVVHSG